MTPSQEARSRLVCPVCHGTGLLEDRICPTCQGTGTIIDPTKTPQSRSRSNVLPLAALIIIGLVGLFGAWHAFGPSPVQLNISQSLSNTNVNSGSDTGPPTTSAPSGTAGGSPTATLAITESTPTISASTPSAQITASPTPPTNPPGMLAVTPTTIHVNLCVAGKATFTIKNTGVGSLDWAVASNALYLFPVKTGTLVGGTQLDVVVNNITLGGTITIAANAPGSPQAIIVTCGV